MHLSYYYPSSITDEGPETQRRGWASSCGRFSQKQTRRQRWVAESISGRSFTSNTWGWRRVRKAGKGGMLICDANAVLPLSSADVMGNSGQSWTFRAVSIWNGSRLCTCPLTCPDGKDLCIGCGGGVWAAQNCAQCTSPRSQSHKWQSCVQSHIHTACPLPLCAVLQSLSYHLRKNVC